MMIGNQGNIHSGYLIFLVLLGPVILVSPTRNSKRECDETPVEECYRKLQTFLRLTALPFTSEKTELDKLCSNVADGYNCSTKKVGIPSCLSPEDKSLMPVFVDMAQYTMFMFCASGDGEQGYMRDALLKNSDCILQQKDALNCCVEQSKLSEFPVLNILEESGKSLGDRQLAACCPVSYFIKCVRSVVVSSCGELVGNVTTEYIRRSSGEELEEVCQKMPNYPELDEDTCKTPLPTCSGATIGFFVELTTVMCLLYIMWIHYL